MTFETIEPQQPEISCHIRSECKRESDSSYFKELFERSWDAFVIRTDEKTGKLTSQIECCGLVTALKNA